MTGSSRREGCFLLCVAGFPTPSLPHKGEEQRRAAGVVDLSPLAPQLPGLARLEHAEALRRDAGGGARREKRLLGRVDRLVGELERPVVVRERVLGAEIEKRLDALLDRK